MAYDSPLSPGAADDNRMTPIKWLICVIAVIGFAFDTFTLLQLPLILRPALMELGGLQPGTPEFSKWAGLLFYVPALAGGVFGLMGGYLTDRLGRRRVLTWSILLYAVSAFLSGYAPNLVVLLILRSASFVGVCVEFVAAVAWLAELFLVPKQREWVLGVTQAFGSLGGVMVAFANDIAIRWSDPNHLRLPGINLPSWAHFGATTAAYDPHAAWRYTLMAGLIPAIPLIVIRPFLPESPVWRQKKSSGTLRRPSIAELFTPQLRRTTLVTTVMFACSLGAAFGAIQQMPQIVPGLPEVQQSIKDEVAKLPALPAKKDASAIAPSVSAGAPASPALAAAAKAPDPRAKGVSGRVVQSNAAAVAKLQEYGGLIGRVILAVLAVVIISRRKLIRIFQIPGLIVMPLVFAYAATRGISGLKTGMFFAGMLTVGQLSFWGNYLPRVYPVHLRGTGESFAANIGGRMIGTCFAWVTASVAGALTPKGASLAEAAHYVAYTAAGVGTVAYLVGFIFSFFLPEPLPEGDAAA